MAMVYLELLRDRFGVAVESAYLKGSVQKPWDSLIDYAPEVSDVDIHVYLTDTRLAAEMLRPDSALDFSRRAEQMFSARVPDAIHLPKPQVKFGHELIGMEGYLPPPSATVELLFGKPQAVAERQEYRNAGTIDRVRLLEDAGYVLDELPLRMFDRPGHHLWELFPRVFWRVSPTCPRILSALGYDAWDAWSANRTGVFHLLCQHGQSEIAEAYAGFYLAAWDGYRSAFSEAAPAYAAIHQVIRMFELARELFERHGEP